MEQHQFGLREWAGLCERKDATIAALQARVQELEESRDAWKASQECSEKAYMALVNQIPAERFDYDPVNVALLDGAKEQEIIGRKQIADLQDLLKRTDENREQWRKLCQEAQSQLTQRTAERDTARRRVDELEAREVDVVMLREDLEQRTAELEAANKLLYKKNCALGRAETIINDLQAKLERVSLLSSHNERRLNCYSEENESNTPDFMLAKFMLSCLEAFNVATRERDRWYGVHLAPGNKYFKEQEPYNPR